MTTLQYQTLVYAAGYSFQCVETYESVFERMRDSAFHVSDEDEGSMRWAAPIELTVRGEHGPLRLALNPPTIAGVMELHEDDRVEVDSE